MVSNSTDRKYQNMVNVTCNSSNLIYMIECTICKIQYVEQTKNKILVRMNQHYSFIKKRYLATSIPILLRDSTPIKIYILILIRGDSDLIESSEQRNKWENYWMVRLYSYISKGLNIKD